MTRENALRSASRGFAFARGVAEVRDTATLEAAALYVSRGEALVAAAAAVIRIDSQVAVLADVIPASAAKLAQAAELIRQAQLLVHEAGLAVPQARFGNASTRAAISLARDSERRAAGMATPAVPVVPAGFDHEKAWREKAK